MVCEGVWTLVAVMVAVPGVVAVKGRANCSLEAWLVTTGVPRVPGPARVKVAPAWAKSLTTAAESMTVVPASTVWVAGPSEMRLWLELLQPARARSVRATRLGRTVGMGGPFFVAGVAGAGSNRRFLRIATE